MRATVIRGLAVALAIACGAVRAGGEAREDRFSWHPSLEIGFEASDNGALALENSRTGSDWTYGGWVEPRLEVEYRRHRVRTGADLGADFRYSFSSSKLTDQFLDLTGFLEVEALRGLTLRISDAYVPQSIRLGAPSDDVSNLRQSNLARAEALYQREFSRGRALELGIEGTRFTSQGFESALDLDGDGLPNVVGNLHADYWGAGAHLEVQQSLGRRSKLYVRGEMRDRSFDEIPRADFSEWSSLLGVRSHVARRLDLDLALGYGRIDFDDLPGDSRLIGRANLDYALSRGWELQGTFVQRFSAGASGSDFGETTARLGVSKRIGSRTRASLGLLWTRFHADAPGADPNLVTAVNFGLERQLTRRIKAELAWRYWRNGGSAESDDLDQNRVTLGFKYQR